MTDSRVTKSAGEGGGEEDARAAENQHEECDDWAQLCNDEELGLGLWLGLIDDALASLRDIVDYFIVRKKD